MNKETCRQLFIEFEKKNSSIENYRIHYISVAKPKVQLNGEKSFLDFCVMYGIITETIRDEYYDKMLAGYNLAMKDK